MPNIFRDHIAPKETDYVERTTNIRFFPKLSKVLHFFSYFCHINMLIMKKILQVLGSVVYTYLFYVIMYLVTVYPFMWFVGLSVLSVFWKIVFIVIFAGLVQGLINLIQAYALLPYVWLLKDNIVATCISIVLLVGCFAWGIFIIWKDLAGNGFWMIVVAVVASLLLIEVIVSTVIPMIGCYTGTIQEGGE